MSQNIKNTKNAKKFNYTKWGFVLTTPIAIVGLGASLTVPEIRCLVRLQSELCPLTETGELVELVTKAETGETLERVKIQYISQGAPETEYTDSNGFARVKIPRKGDVNVTLTKDGYPTQDFTIDLQNDQSRTRIIRLQKTGIPDVQPLKPSPSPVSGQPQPNDSTPSTSNPTSLLNGEDAQKNLETLLKTKKCPDCYLVGVNINGASLENANLSGANLRGSSSNGGNRTNLHGADLSGADLRGFSHDNIGRVTFQGANLSRANLSGASFNNVNFQGANLSGANFDGADLSGANLRGADLSNVNLSNVKLDSADLSGTILPKEFESLRK